MNITPESSPVLAIIASLLAALLAAAAQEPPAAPSPQADMQRARKEAAHRTRRIIFDNDGNEPVYYCNEATPECLLEQRTTALAGSQVDTIFYCTWSSGFSMFTHDTKKGVVFDCTAEEPGKGPGSGFSKNKTRAFLDQGLDPLRIVIDWCRSHQVEVFWSMRMNDTHDGGGAWYSPFMFPPLKKEHPEWLMGSADHRPKNGAWTAVDYGRPEIRDLAFQYIEEVCRNYDVDGVQLDFFRHPVYFRKHAWGEPVGQEELDMMTGLIRRVRTMADQVAVEKGHPILLSVRVPDSVDYCKAIGFDIERWMKEDLIDLLVLSGYFRLNPWDVSVKLAHTYNVPVYPCLSESRMKGEAGKVRSTLECYRARAAEVWDAGADGIYLFNFFNPKSPLWRELGSVETLRGLDKVYTTGTRGVDALGYWYKDGESFVHRSLLSPSRPRKLEPAQPEAVEIIVGDDVAAGGTPTVTARVQVEALTKPEDLAVTINGTPLEQPVAADTWLEYAVEPALVKKGTNRFEFALAEGVPAGPVLQDLLLWVRYNKVL